MIWHLGRRLHRFHRPRRSLWRVFVIGVLLLKTRQFETASRDFNDIFRKYSNEKSLNSRPNRTDFEIVTDAIARCAPVHLACTHTLSVMSGPSIIYCHFTYLDVSNEPYTHKFR